MKQAIDAAVREAMLKEQEAKGYTPATTDILASKGMFTQNLLLKGDVIEFPEFDIQNFVQGKPFKTLDKNGDEIEVRGILAYIRVNNVWRFFPLGTFQRGSQVANREDFVAACRDKYEFNLRILTLNDQLELAQFLSGQRFKVVENQQFKFQRFKDRKPVEGEFDLKAVSMFEVLPD